MIKKDNEGLVIPTRCLTCNNYKKLCEGNLMIKGCVLIKCGGYNVENIKKIPFPIIEKKKKAKKS